MKREILFKGKRVDNGEWIFGDLIKGNVKTYIFYNLPFELKIESNFNIDKFEVHPKTVCQFTGLLDKNGNKIFEWDKVKFRNFRGVNGMKISKHDGWIEGFEGIIEWKNQFGWFLNKDNDNNSKILKAKGEETESRKCSLVITNSNICEFETEINGNIHD